LPPLGGLFLPPVVTHLAEYKVTPLDILVHRYLVTAKITLFATAIGAAISEAILLATVHAFKHNHPLNINKNNRCDEHGKNAAQNSVDTLFYLLFSFLIHC
jgi:hypothetical protein